MSASMENTYIFGYFQEIIIFNALSDILINIYRYFLSNIELQLLSNPHNFYVSIYI